MFEKIFLSQDFWVDSPVSQAPGSHFKMLITQPKSKKSQNDTRRSCLVEKNEYKKSRETLPLSESVNHQYKIIFKLMYKAKIWLK